MHLSDDENPYKAPLAESIPEVPEVRNDWPPWVTLCLLKSGRLGALIWLFYFLALAVACTTLAFLVPWYAAGIGIGFLSLLSVVGAIWYYAAIRWVDRHSRWE